MKRTENLLLHISIALNALLAFLVLFEGRIAVPVWLQVAGRMHPLVLHFPIVLIVLVALFGWLHPNRQAALPGNFTVWLTVAAVAAAFSAVSGLFLSREEGYDTEGIAWHKWGGVALSLLLLCWVLLYPKMAGRRLYSRIAAATCLLTVVITGHWGAGITHGEDFLLAPVQQRQEQPMVLLDDARLFQDMVQPILENKCMGCHNNNKAKGELVMETEASLLLGGKSGKLWNLQEQGFGLMMQRIHLPLQDKKHMPPGGKPQLTDEEIFMLGQWLARGASFKQQIADLPENDTLRKLAAAKFRKAGEENYDFPAADAGLISKLNSANRTVKPLALNSPALSVEFFGRSRFESSQLEELTAIEEQIVSLNLNKMPLRDEDVRIIARFKNLKRLNLSFTDITAAGLGTLQELPQLEQLSVSGTRLTGKDLTSLKTMGRLNTLYAWNTRTTDAERAGIQQALGKTLIQWGFAGDTILMKLNAPIVENDAQIITEPVELKLKHFLPGVKIHYTLDGTEPDSLRSPVYKTGIMISRQGIMKARAFKAGWISSDVSELTFFRNKFRPDSMVALLPPDKAYKGNGANTLKDNIKGDKNFRSGKWLGYQNNNLDVLLQFKQHTPVTSITLSSLVDVGRHIMPPVSIEVWGGNSASDMKLLHRMRPAQPAKEIPGYLEGFDCRFQPVTIKYIRVIARPLNVLPAWHRGKGSKAWIFADEIFVN